VSVLISRIHPDDATFNTEPMTSPTADDVRVRAMPTIAGSVGVSEGLGQVPSWTRVDQDDDDDDGSGDDDPAETHASATHAMGSIAATTAIRQRPPKKSKSAAAVVAEDEEDEEGGEVEEAGDAATGGDDAEEQDEDAKHAENDDDDDDDDDVVDDDDDDDAAEEDADQAVSDDEDDDEEDSSPASTSAAAGRSVSSVSVFEEAEAALAATMHGGRGVPVATNRALNWIFRRLSYLSRKKQPKSIECVFRWFASMTTHLGAAKVVPYLLPMMFPLYRAATLAPNNASNVKLKAFAEEVLAVIQATIGATSFLDVYNRVRDSLQHARAQRKAKRAQQAVTNPVAFSKRKLAESARKRVVKKRKMQQMKAIRRGERLASAAPASANQFPADQRMKKKRPA
jgi:hypothetical protein